MSRVDKGEDGDDEQSIKSAQLQKLPFYFFPDLSTLLAC